MTTEALRKDIYVTGWRLTDAGLTISYERETHLPKSLHLILSPDETIRELTVIGSIDSAEYYGGSHMAINYNEACYSWNGILEVYKTCQWEALSIAIRHEEVKELANDMSMLELDSAINALK
jgi:hypothetical protein